MYVLLLQHDMAKTLVWRHKLKYKPDMSNDMRQQRSMAFFFNYQVLLLLLTAVFSVGM